MDDLATWLRAQMNQSADRARALLVDAQRTTLTLQDPRHLGKFIPGWHDWPRVEQTCQERLAEIDAKRRILDLHHAEDGCCYTCSDKRGDSTERAPCPTVRLLALPMADRPGYDESWRP